MKRGFTLIEILLSMVILAIIVGISAPVLVSFQRRDDLDLATSSVAQAMHRAQNLSWGVYQDDNWGVEVQSGVITVFKGSIFSSRDASYDETFNVPTVINFTGLNEVIFNKFTGDPVTPGAVSLTNATENQTKTVNVNAKGMVTY